MQHFGGLADALALFDLRMTPVQLASFRLRLVTFQRLLRTMKER